MFSKVGQIMLYVNNQDEALAFWTEVAGFHIVDEVTLDGGMRWIEIAPTKIPRQALYCMTKRSWHGCRRGQSRHTFIDVFHR